ncbi:hypothetical protein GCM10008967_03080 [Bacillus carboniphilus]|uniref:Endonuclease n=1 Tax=Bacillus carboniphilus TaxID=86663 RepID=A0ABN0VS31_9BACI
MKLSPSNVGKLLLVLVLTFSLFVPYVSKAETGTDAITVSEAIANNSGTATVEGYIVGHTKATNSYDFEAPFGNDYNIAIADSPTETDASKILPVQLTSDFRAEFGLLTNPDIIGSKIQVTGSLEAYFSVPALKSPTNMEFVEGEPTPEEPTDPQDLTIAEAKTKNGQTVTVQGVVTADNSAIGGGKLSTYMEDDTGGINIFAFDPTGFPELEAGDEVKVTGEITSYNGLTEIVPESDGVEVLAKNQPLPSAKVVDLSLFTSDAAEPYEGTLIEVEAFVQSIPGSPAGGGYNVTIVDDEFNGTTLRVMEDTNAISALEAGKWYTLTGIVSQYNSYQLIIRSANDVQLLEEQLPAPNPSGEYTSTVARVVDGDTIHLETPVLGTTTVRFVNMDTPETYHSVKNELDQNQLDHGNAAKEYMNTLLKAGDEVIVKVGQEAHDDYGRLLGQVIRKSDNLNTNLEMVEKGYAVTYFIWPVGDETEYEQFQAAVREAKQNEWGIWNPEDPLLELPFEFRAREQGNKGFSKPVGNSDTKEYVEPNSWELVPVDKRIFFWSEEEAQAAGYTPAEGTTPEEPEEPTIQTIAEARAKASGETVTVEGIVTTVPGIWGSKGFYIQDETAGIYVYQSNSGIKQGDQVRIDAELDEFNGEKQLGNATIEVISSNVALPAPVVVTPAEVNEDVQGEVVTLEGVTVTNVKELSYGTVEFHAVNGDESVLVRLDNRTGYDYDAFSADFNEGDVINVTGIGSVFKGTYQVKPRSESDFMLAEINSGTLVFKTGTENGRKVELILSGQDLNNLRAGKLTLTFDEKSLNFLGATGLVEQVTNPVVTETKGKVDMAFAKLGDQGLSGNQELFALTFVQKGKPNQDWSIKVNNIVLADSEGKEEIQAGFVYHFSGEVSQSVGDLNEDGHVTVADLALLSTYMGTDHTEADLNKDGKVDQKDYEILVKII